MPLPDTLEDTESFESRKTPIQTKEEESVVTSNPYAHDWKTSYRQKIEEANGNLSLYDSAEDTKDTAEKKWYHPNYSQKSGKVVRFYGLDTCEDPCQEVKTNKKQRIRMVRFSFDNEFCNITKSPPVEICRKFSVIPEEPEMDPALLDDVVTSLSDNLEIKDCNLTEDVVDHDDTQLQGTKCEASCQDNDCATVDVVQSTVEEQKTRFTVQKVQGSDLSECASQELESQEVKEDGDVTQTVVSELEDSEASESKPSRFIVQRVQDTDVELSQVATVENLDASDSLNQTEKRSRFSVQRVSEPTLIESSPQMTMANETTTSSSSDIDESRIVHQNYPQSTVIDDTASNSSVIKNNSRFVVQRVLEPKLTVVHSQQVTNEDIKVRCENDDGQVNIPKDCVPDVSMQESKFRVEQVSESNLTSHNSSMEMSPNIQPSEEVNSIGVQKKSRFVVQRVTEPDNPLVLKTDDRLKSHQGETADDTESHRISSPGNQLLTEKKSRFAVCRVPELTLEQTSVQHPSGDANKLQNNNVDRNHNQVERKSRFVVQRVYDDALQDIDNREKHCNNNDICIDKMDNGYRPFSREECDNFQNWQVLLKNGVNSSLSSADGGVKNSNNSAKDLTETTIDEARLRGGQFEVVSCS